MLLKIVQLTNLITIHCVVMMMQRAIKYLFAFSLPAGVFHAFYIGGWYYFVPVIFSFVIVPLLDALIPLDATNLSPEEEERWKNSFVFLIPLYAVVPVQLLVLYTFLCLPFETMELAEKIGAISAAGMSCGVLGINVAHELGHKNRKTDKFLAHVLLGTSLYMHFYIEHNYGHHRRVATPEDPATARKGESLYFFWWRSVTQSYRSAWEIQMQLLKGMSFFSWKNNMLWYTIAQLLLLLGIYTGFGFWALIAFLCAAVMGILLLETVNYIEHYGLRRAKVRGGYERTTFEHSWNSDHVVGRAVLFDLSRHSDHHYKSTRPYQVLRHFDDSPQLPAGYPAMMVLAMFPPLWFAVMDRRLN
ncbi:MAG: alkane 1-monooxygenase [Bacteroidota bacterium]